MPRASEPSRGTHRQEHSYSERIAGIVLAAGASRRMGASVNKLLLEIEGEPMVRRTVRQVVEASLEPIVIVTGHEPERVQAALEGLPWTFVHNPEYSGPTSTSLHAALRALDETIAAALVMLGDMVRVTAEMMRAIVTSARESGAPLVVSRYGPEQVLAPPLLFRRVLWPELLAWTGEGCGKSVATSHLREAVILDWPVDALRDVDTPEDYQALR